MDMHGSRDPNLVHGLGSELEPRVPATTMGMECLGTEGTLEPISTSAVSEFMGEPGTPEADPELDCHLEAHKIVSISLGKIYHSQVQRGGSSKLRKNLLVSLVLRSAQKVYLSRSPEATQGWHRLEGTPFFQGPEEAQCDQGPVGTQSSPVFEDTESHPCLGLHDYECQPMGNHSDIAPQTSLCQPMGDHSDLAPQTRDHCLCQPEGIHSDLAPQTSDNCLCQPQGIHSDLAPQTSDNNLCQPEGIHSDLAPQTRDSLCQPEGIHSDLAPQIRDSLCQPEKIHSDLAPRTSDNSLCQPEENQDDRTYQIGDKMAGKSWRAYRPSMEREIFSDTDFSLWGSNGDGPEQDIGARASRKRGADQGVGEVTGPKRGRWEPGDQEVPEPGEEEGEMDTGNVTSLINVFGSGFSGLLGKEGASESSGESPQDLGSPGPKQGCCERGLNASLGSWSTAIEAF